MQLSYAYILWYHTTEKERCTHSEYPTRNNTKYHNEWFLKKFEKVLRVLEVKKFKKINKYIKLGLVLTFESI